MRNLQVNISAKIGKVSGGPAALDALRKQLRAKPINIDIKINDRPLKSTFDLLNKTAHKAAELQKAITAVGKELPKAVSPAKMVAGYMEAGARSAERMLAAARAASRVRVRSGVGGRLGRGKGGKLGLVADVAGGVLENVDLGDMGPSALGSLFRSAQNIGIGAATGAIGGPQGALAGGVAGGVQSLIEVAADIRQAGQFKTPEHIQKRFDDQDFLKSFAPKFDQTFRSIGNRQGRSGNDLAKDLVRQNMPRLREIAERFGDSPEATEINRILRTSGFGTIKVQSPLEKKRESLFRQLDEEGKNLFAGTQQRAENYASLRTEREKLRLLQGGKPVEYNAAYLERVRTGLKGNISAQKQLGEKLQAPGATTGPEYQEQLNQYAKLTEAISHGESELRKFADAATMGAEVQKQLNTLKQKEADLTNSALGYINMDEAGRRAFEGRIDAARKFAGDKGQQGLFNTMPIAQQQQIVSGLLSSQNVGRKIGAGGETGQELVDKITQGLGPLFQLTAEEKQQKADLANQQKAINENAIQAQQQIIEMANARNQEFLDNLNVSFNRLIAELNRIAVRPAQRMATGGVAGLHPGKPSQTDTQAAWLTPGEWVINRRSAQKYGAILEQINNGTYPIYAAAGQQISPAQKRFNRRHSLRGFTDPQISALWNARENDPADYRAMRRGFSQERLGRLSRSDRRLARRGMLGVKGEFQNAMKAWQANPRGLMPNMGQLMAGHTERAVASRGAARRLARRQRLAGRGVRYYASGGSVSGGGLDDFDMGTMRSLASAIRGMPTSIQLGGLSQWVSISAELIQAMNSMPRTISMQGTHQVHVIVNGADILNEITPYITRKIDEGIAKATRGMYRGMSQEDGEVFRALDGGRNT